MSLDSKAPLTFEAKLARMYAADPASDGRFITGVLSTGIYCLPSCPARKPKAENVVFFDEERDARAAGFRPCKRCRPDDFYAGRDHDFELLNGLLDRLRRRPASFPTVASLAECAGIGPSKLHQLSRRYLDTTPAELMHQARIRAARELLKRGDAATDVAFAVGYASVSAFYRRFKQSTGQTPSAFARRSPGSDVEPEISD